MYLRSLELATEACSHGFYHGSLPIVLLQCPHIGPAKTFRNLGVYITHLQRCCGGIVVGIEGPAGRIVERHRSSVLIEVSAEAIRCECGERRVGEKSRS